MFDVLPRLVNLALGNLLVSGKNPTSHSFFACFEQCIRKYGTNELLKRALILTCWEGHPPRGEVLCLLLKWMMTKKTVQRLFNISYIMWMVTEKYVDYNIMFQIV